MSSFEKPPSPEERPMSRLVNGERIGISEEAFRTFTEKLTALYPASKPVSVVLEEWKPAEVKLPHHTSVYASAIERNGKKELRITSMHPKELTEEDLRWLFGEAFFETSGIPTSSVGPPKVFERMAKTQAALQSLLETRRYAVCGKMLEEHCPDEGLRAVLRRVVDGGVGVIVMPASETEHEPGYKEGYAVISFLPMLLRSSAVKFGEAAIGLLRLRLERLRETWETLSEEERRRVRVALDQCIEDVGDRETIP
jgi:hypothetical protein